MAQEANSTNCTSARGGGFYRAQGIACMSFGPTGRCSFCGGVYYTQKLAVHESICSARPRKLTVAKAVRIVIELHPEASKDRALLVRLVWQIADGYRTEFPLTRLTDPRLILTRARSATRH